MMQTMESEFYEPSPLLRELQVLSILDRNPEASQKDVALRVGLAPSMVHNYIHALALRGLIQFEGPTRRQLRYIVTTSGRDRIRLLARRHVADAGRLLERIASRLRWEIGSIVPDEIRTLAVVAPPALAGTLERLAQEMGIEVVHLGDPSQRAEQGEEALCLDGVDAVVVAEDPAQEHVSDVVHRCHEQGLKVFILA